MQYINLGSYVTVPAGVTLHNGPVAMQGQQALSAKVLNSPAHGPSPPSASGARSLFVLSIAIQLFEFDTRFMTTSIHLPVSDDSVAHTPLMYSGERGGDVLEKRHTSHLITRSSLMNHAAVDNSAISKAAFHLTSQMNRRGTLLLTQKVTADQHKTNCFFTLSVNEMRPEHNGVMYQS